MPVPPSLSRDDRPGAVERTDAQQAAAAADLARWMTSGLRAPIGVVLALSETAAAHRLQEQGTIGRTGGLAGKIVIEP